MLARPMQTSNQQTLVRFVVGDIQSAEVGRQIAFRD